MPVITLKKQVAINSFGTAAADESIGTQGCATCVGLILVGHDGTKYCAHFSCAIQARTVEVNQIIKFSTNLLLTNLFPKPSDIRSGTMVTMSPDKETKLIMEGITDKFGENITVVAGDMIVCTKAGEIKTPGWNTKLNGTEVIENRLAIVGITPMKVLRIRGG